MVNAGPSRTLTPLCQCHTRSNSSLLRAPRSPPDGSEPHKTLQNEPPRARTLDTFIKSSSDQLDPHMKFKPSSSQFMPTSCQLKVGQYARTIFHDSPAPHSYDPTMGRRQRRQPINPPRCSRLLEVPKAFETMDLSKASASVSFL